MALQTINIGSLANDGTGDPLRTAMNKVNDNFAVLDTVFNVCDPDYGAVGDGVTDDTAAIQAAVDDAEAAGGGDVYFPARQFMVVGPVHPKAGVRFRGAGIEATEIIKGSSNFIATGVQSSHYLPDFYISDMTITGDWQDTQDDGGTTPIFCYGIDDVIVERICVQYTRAFGIGFRGSENVSVKNCIFQYCARDPMNLYQCNNVLVDGNVIKHCDDDAVGCGASELEGNTPDDPSGACIITNNFVYDSQWCFN
jgi:polygalacturonase